MKNTSITPGQKKQYLRFVEDAAEKAMEQSGIDKDGIQKLIENGDEFQAHIIAGIKELSVPNQSACSVGKFANEEVESSYAYPNGYKVEGIATQAGILRDLFPELDGALVDGSIPVTRQLPPNAEGWFAIPKWQTLAPTYGEAVEKVLAMIASKRKFYNLRGGQLGAEYLRQHAKTAKMFEILANKQKGHDILVVPTQFGLRHRGRSARRAREVFAANEFGLGAFAIGIMLLTHPEREAQWVQLHVDCAGDEFAPGPGAGFSVAPIFDFCDDKVRFYAHWCDFARGNYGSASGFLQPASQEL